MSSVGRSTVSASLYVGPGDQPAPASPSPAGSQPTPAPMSPAPSAAPAPSEEEGSGEDGDPDLGCSGPPESHCCWIDGQVCRHALMTGSRVWCLLMLEHQDWAKVHADPRYQRDVQPTFDRLFPGFGCGDYPQNIPVLMGDPDAQRCCYG